MKADLTLAFPRVVLRTGIALFVLWAVSFALSYVHLGAAAMPIALGIAALKAGLVVAFFMELAHGSFSMKLAFGAAALLLLVLIGLVLADVALREPAPLAPRLSGIVGCIDARSCAPPHDPSSVAPRSSGSRSRRRPAAARRRLSS